MDETTEVNLEIVERRWPHVGFGFWLVKTNSGAPFTEGGPLARTILGGPFLTMEDAARALENEAQLLP